MKEKSEFEKRAAEKQVSLLTEALTSTVDAKGHWLNASGKLYPKLYPKGFSVSPFNALILALDSDAKGCKSNLFTQFSEAKARGESVREHEKGVPFLYYNWNKYVNRNNPDDVITKEAYAELSDQGKQQYKGVKNREIRVLFNIDQTLLPMANETAYTTVLKKDGTMEDRGYGDKEDKRLHGRVNGFLQKMKDNLVNVRQDGTGVAHYDTEKDVIYLPRQRDFEHYNDYVQEMMRQLVSATGHQQRLAREGMVMKNGKAPSEDAVKKEKLITELASGVKMLELGLPARLSKDSLGMVDYWTRELKEDPCLIDAIESEVNGALKVLKKAELGEKVEYATNQHQRETAQMQGQLPNHYFVADEIKQHPNEEQRTVVIVRDDASKTADVVLPQGASLEVNNEIKGMNKQRFTNALQKEGYDNVRFYNPDGALGFRPDDSYFADKKITVSRLRNWSIEDLSSLDASEAVIHSRDIGFDNVQLVKDDKERWALYIKPEGKEGFAVYPDKGDLNHFFTTLKQSMDNIERVREELAQKYYAMAEAKPDLKVDIFGGNEQEVDLNRIQRVAVFRAKSGECLCAATIDGKKLQPRSVSPSQWQRLWVAPDRDSYKQSLAASLFADVLQKDNNVEQSTQEKQEEATEVKQAETATVVKNEEQKEMVQQEDKPSDQKEQASEQREEKKEEKAVKGAISPLVQQYLDLKKKHPDAILLFRCGDFYETYKDDAVKASNILGITLTKSNGRKDDEGKPLAMAGFPYHALDTYLPKLIRAGERVAICDQLEVPKQTTSSKRGITEMVSPGKRGWKADGTGESGNRTTHQSKEIGLWEKNAAYAAQYAEEAKEQMRRYGIPASVILAQAILESSNGQSQLSRECNNHFGIKATASWLKNGGEYGVYTDDKPNEKFCKYKSVGDSYEHHSQFLKQNKRYAKCFTLSPDDYKGWTKDIERAGYATGGGYAASLQRIIEANGLDKYDREVMAEMRAEGRSFGVENNPRRETPAAHVPQSAGYSFPVEREEFLFITSPFGNRQDPMDATKQQMHKGIDIKTNHEAVLATENGGKVVAVNHNANTSGGKSVTVEYSREGGSKVQCSYLHLSDIAVKVGDTVNAGQKLGVSGNTGTRTTGEHLHFGVKSVSADGSKRDMDPAAYLAEIGQKGNIKLQALHNGNDLLAKYKSDAPQEQKVSSEDWMKKLLSSEDSGVGISGTNDPILDMAMTTFMSLMMLAAQIDSKDEERQKGFISAMAANRLVDLTSLVPGMRQCAITVGENGKTVLHAESGTVKIDRELTSSEMNRLSLILGNANLSEESKRTKIAGIVTGIVATQQASQNFEQGMEAESQQQNLQRK